LLLLSLRPGAGALFDGHRISSSIIATQDPDPPADAAGWVFHFSGSNIRQTTKG